MGYNTTVERLLDAIKTNTKSINVSVDTDLEINTDALETKQDLTTAAVNANTSSMLGTKQAMQTAHAGGDIGTPIVGVRNDTLADLAGADHDYGPIQLNAEGALYTAPVGSHKINDAVSNSTASGHLPMAVRKDADTAFANVADGDAHPLLLNNKGYLKVSTGPGTQVGGTFPPDERTGTDALSAGDEALPTLNAAGELVVALSATNNAVLDNLTTIDADTGAMATDLAAIEVLLTAIDADTNAIKTAVEILDNAISGSEMQVDVVASLPAGTNVIGAVVMAAGSAAIGTVTLSAIDNAVLDTIDAVLDTIKVDTEAIETAVEAIQVDAAAIETLLTAANVDHAANEALLTTIDADTNAMKVDLAAIEVLSTAANVDLAAMEVLLTAANVDHAATEVLLTGIDADTDAIKTNTESVKDATENIESEVTGLLRAEDTAHSSGHKGVMSLTVRNDALAPLAGADGDYAPMQVDATGALYTNNQFGTFGSILVTGTTATTCAVADRCFVAIYMLTNTVFNSASGGLVAETEQLYLDDTGAGTSIDGDAGAAIDGITFPAGMTLYGRYDGFTLVSGSVVAYVG